MRAVALGAVILAVMALAIVAASSQPDALEAALERVGLTGHGTAMPAPFPDYASPTGGPWVAGVIGLVAAFLVAWGVAIAITRRRA